MLETTLLFTFINDLAKSTCNPCHLFADDAEESDLELEQDMKADLWGGVHRKLNGWFYGCFLSQTVLERGEKDPG